MGQVPGIQDNLTPRARIVWRRAADELLIAAIFAGDAALPESARDRRQGTAIGSNSGQIVTAPADKLRSAA